MKSDNCQIPFRLNLPNTYKRKQEIGDKKTREFKEKKTINKIVWAIRLKIEALQNGLTKRLVMPRVSFVSFEDDSVMLQNAKYTSPRSVMLESFGHIEHCFILISIFYFFINLILVGTLGRHSESYKANDWVN